MSKRKKNKFKKRKAKVNSDHEKNIKDTVSNDIKKSSTEKEPQLSTPTSMSRLSCYVTPKMSPFTTQIYQDNTKIQEPLQSVNTSSQFYTCNDKQLESDQHFQITLEKRRKLLCNETPKCSKIRQRQEFLLDSPGPLIRKNANKFSWCQVNINPYLKNQDVNTKESNYGDLSFSPNQFSSTPVAQHPRKTIENFAECSFDGVRNENIISPKTPTYNKNINLNNSYTTEKVMAKDNSMKNRKLHTINMSGKMNLSSSNPKDRVISHNFKYSRNISKKSLYLSVSSPETTSYFLERLKRYYKIARNWFARIWDFAGHLKKDTVGAGQDIVDPFQVVCNRCVQYEENISKLTKRIDELTESQSGSVEQMKQFNHQLNEIKQHMDKFNDLQTELEMLKEQVKMTKTASFVPNILPSVPPPPPPPLPPPVLPISETKTYFNFQKKSNSGTKSPTNQNLRPVISREDILNVKLKKISTRPYQPISRRNSCSTSLDVLKTVTLKPVPCTPHLLSTPENDTVDMTLSPNTKLCTLLKNEIPSHRIKRLQRVGKYSCDSLYRRKLLDSRDREYN